MDKYRTLQQILGICKAIYGNEESIRLNLEVINLYLTQDEVPLDEVISSFTGIISSRIRDKDRVIRRFRSEGIIPYQYYYKNYTDDVAAVLETCTRKIIAEMELTEKDYDKLRHIADEHSVRNPFYVELLDKMHKNGIYFKNEEKPKEKDSDG